MSGNLEDAASRLVQEALAAGTWVEAHDTRQSQTYYFCPATKQTTRDLRMTLLRDFNAVAPTQLRADVSAQGSAAPTTEKDHEAVADAYEAEITHLRRCVFGLQPSVQAPPDATSDVAVLQQQLAAARRLNVKLYDRVADDRQRAMLCRRCADVLPAGAVVVHPSPLVASAAHSTFPQSLKPFTSFATDNVMLRQSRDRDGMSGGPTPGYLPSSFRPATDGVDPVTHRSAAQSSTSHGLLQAMPRFGIERAQTSMQPARDTAITGSPLIARSAVIPSALYAGGLFMPSTQHEGVGVLSK
jgi:hypothetical protein